VKNLIVLNADKVTVGVLSSVMPRACPFFDDLYTESLDTFVNTLEFSIPATHEKAVTVQEGGFILYPTEETYRLMRIIKVTDGYSATQAPTRKVECEQAATSDLLSTINEPKTWTSATLKDVLTYALTGTIWTLGHVDNFGATKYEITSHQTALKTVTDALKFYKAEHYYQATLTGSRVTKYIMNAVYERGTEDIKPFYYGKRITGVERIADTSQLVTAMYGIGRDKDNNPIYIDSSVTVPAGYKVVGKTIRFEEAYHNYANNGADLIGIHELEKNGYGDDYVAPTKQEIANAVVEKLKEFARPRLTYKVDAELLGYNVNLGDTVMVHDELLVPQVLVYARIRKIVRSLTDPKGDRVEFGDYIQITPKIPDIVRQMQEKIEKNEAEWAAAAYTVSIESTEGFQFEEGSVLTTLKAKLMRNGIDVTDTYPASSYNWVRTSKDPAGDLAWNDLHQGMKEVVIDNDDLILNNATFGINVTI
jgi:phage minor structural protein